LTDQLAEPAMAADGVLSGSLGAVIGVGPGRGIALIFLGIGASMLLLAAVAAGLPKVRRLDVQDDADESIRDEEAIGATQPA
jgi:hypothetical protein